MKAWLFHLKSRLNLIAPEGSDKAEHSPVANKDSTITWNTWHVKAGIAVGFFIIILVPCVIFSVLSHKQSGVAAKPLATKRDGIATLSKKEQPGKTSPAASQLVNAEITQAQQSLDDISLRLAKISQQEKAGQEKEQTINAMSQVLNTMQQQVEALAKQPSTKDVSQAIKTQSQQLTAKLQKVETAVNTLRNEVITKHYLDPKVLPFKVEAIEYWNERPFVRLVDRRHPYRNALDGVGDTQGQWTVKSIMPQQQQVVFINPKKQQVKVTLKGELV